MQEPRVSHVPDYISTAGLEAIELAELAGLYLDDWQKLVVAHSLGERLDGKWSAPNVGLLVPRQNGKGSILECRELAGAFLIGERVIIHSAHEQATASEQFRRLLDLIEGVPELDRRVQKVVKGKGSEAIELAGGERIFFKTRTSGGGRGFTADCLIYDEAMELPESFVASVSPTLAARSLLTQTGVQTWFVGSAVDQLTQHNGVVFARIRERGHNGDGRVAWFEWSCDFGSPDQLTADDLRDPRLWAQANPGLGIRIAGEHVEGEIPILGPRGFPVERLSVGDWPATTTEGSWVIPAAQWRSRADTTSRITSERTFAVDVTPGRDKASIAVSGTRTDGLWHVEIVENDAGTGWLLPACTTLQKKYPRSVFVIDARSPAATEVADLRAARIKVVETSTQEYVHACGDFYDTVMQDLLCYPDPQPEIESALGSAEKRPAGDAWLWDRRGGADISPLVACTLALWGAKQPKKVPRVIDLAEVLRNAPSS